MPPIQLEFRNLAVEIQEATSLYKTRKRLEEYSIIEGYSIEDSFRSLNKMLLPLAWISVGFFVGSRVLDEKAFQLINMDLPSILSPALVFTWDTLMVFLTNLGDAIVLIWAFLLFNLVALLRNGTFIVEDLKFRLMLFAVMLVVSTLPVQILKEVLVELRPAGVLGFDQLRILAATPKDFSFPSGHTAGIFACMGSILPMIPSKMHRAGLLLAIAVGGSRIVVGAHWPLDVTVGAMIGIASAIISWRICVIVQRGVEGHQKSCRVVRQFLVVTSIVLIAIACIYSAFFQSENQNLIIVLLIATILTMLYIQFDQILRDDLKVNQFSIPEQG